MQKIMRLTLSGIALIVLASTLWMNYVNSKANRIVDEANAAAIAGNDFAAQGGAKYSELFTEENLAGFPANREQLTPIAEMLADFMGKAAEQYKIAATKFDEASNEGVKEVVADYWKLKNQEFNKFSASKQSFREVALLIPDASVDSLDAFNEKASGLIDSALKLDAESKELSAQADKLKAENEDSFR